uniref:Uncharacterized protein n=1 Tax=Cacopsylla melanoneura TaxID=428564 RepID=A0A8D9AL72_9HEMI
MKNMYLLVCFIYTLTTKRKRKLGGKKKVFLITIWTMGPVTHFCNPNFICISHSLLENIGLKKLPKPNYKKTFVIERERVVEGHSLFDSCIRFGPAIYSV